MKILFTGASSFTGLWFVKELAAAGHEITAVFQRPLESYAGMRRLRLEQLLPYCKPIFETSFGDGRFLESIMEGGPWDLFCHHAADVANYKSPDFNAAGALANNTHNIKNVLQALHEADCKGVLLSGSVFEQNEGCGSKPLRAFSPYGLSKGMTADSFAFYTSAIGMKLGKFVIANPFGPFEEARFTTYLAQSWLGGRVPSVNTPMYVRDNLPVSLLAKAYCDFARQLYSSQGNLKICPSWHAESQEAFAKRFSSEMEKRLQVPCLLEIREQQDFGEPLIRINTDLLDRKTLQWDESGFWDELACFYTSQSLVCQKA